MDVADIRKESIENMGALYINRTRLTLDMYEEGITKNYKASNKVLRAFATAYAILLLFVGYVCLMNWNFTVAIPLMLFGGFTLYWFYFGYRRRAKKSFMDFAKLHDSHYYVDMEYRFYKDHIEQETEKTILSVPYEDITSICDLVNTMVIVFKKQVIVLEKSAFEIEGELELLMKMFKERNIKIREY